MKPQIDKFIIEYIKAGCKDASQAAISAGYSKKTAYKQASRLLKNGKVAAAIQKALDKQQARALIDKDRVLAELYRVGTCDIGQAFDKDGRLLPLDEMPEDVRRAIASIEVETVTEHLDRADEGDSGSEDVRVTKIRFWDKPKCLEMIGRHFRMFVDRIEVKDATDRAAMLAEARKRADEMKDDKPHPGKH